MRRKTPKPGPYKTPPKLTPPYPEPGHIHLTEDGHDPRSVRQKQRDWEADYEKSGGYASGLYGKMILWKIEECDVCNKKEDDK